MGERTKLSKVLRVERRYVRTSPFTISSTDKCCTCICLSSSRKRNRDSPDQTTFFQRSKVKFWCSHAKGLWLTCDFAIPYKASCGALCLDSYMKLFSAISVILALFFLFFFLNIVPHGPAFVPCANQWALGAYVPVTGLLVALPWTAFGWYSPLQDIF